MSNTEVEMLTTEAFNTRVRNGRGLAVVDFYADWCRPCVAMAPAFAAVAREFGTQVLFAKVNVDEAQDLAREFNIRSIPCLIAFEDGQAVGQVLGSRSQADLRHSVVHFVNGDGFSDHDHHAH